MSLPDYLLDGPNIVCTACGAVINVFQVPLCTDCRADLEDLYADEKISEGKVRQ